MSLFINTKHRSEAIEWMDDFNIHGEELKNTLDQLANINKWLGGNQIIINGLHKLIETNPKSDLISIIDMGCGHGDSLRLLANWGRKNKLTLKLKGIDANVHAINYGIALSKDYPEISYLHADMENVAEKELQCDIAFGTLFFHHFSRDKMGSIIERQLKHTKTGMVVNDLHRHWLAYRLFAMISWFIGNKMIKNDGLISILRGFKRKELKVITNQLKGNHSIKWKWAFRYQWIISL